MKTLNKATLISLLGLSLMACGGNTAPTNNATTNTNATANVANNATNTPANSANTTAPTNNTNAVAPTNAANTAGKPANAAAAKPAESGPKRVSFAAGKSEGNESVSLAAGESKQFVVGAKSGQIFMVDADSKDLEIKMVKGKDTAQKTEPGYYDSTLLADGDFVFQVKNPTKKEVKSSVKIIISHTGISNR
jgi:hypothetical protein